MLWAAPGLLWAALEGHAPRVLAAPAPAAAATATADATAPFNFRSNGRMFARVVPPTRIANHQLSGARVAHKHSTPSQGQHS